MALEEQDREWIQLTARELCREVTTQIIKEQIRGLLIGVSIGSALCGSSVAVAFVKFLMAG